MTSRDTLGWRRVFAVVGPSTNTVVEPEFAAMRPAGVTNQYRDIYIENARALSDEAFMAGAEVITGAVDAALRTAMTCEPDYLVMGVSAITFIGGAPACERFVSHVHELTGKQVSVGSVSCVEAMKAYGGIRRIAVLSPYYPMANMHVARYFSDYGITTVRDLPLRCKSWTDISRVTERQIADALKQLDGDDIDAVVQVGTNLSMARMAPVAEAFLGKPVIAINTATYWHALRSNGIHDAVDGFGPLLTHLDLSKG
ncbi:MAG: arylmalonate decarboxylase [Rubrivivax sp.]|nr:arylmalonate decarboxylase [Rubrivivax sp.]MBK7262452.1 arylmalonate decarboxylase [Rubrivivax sp.]